jgi:hypothetical protein
MSDETKPAGRKRGPKPKGETAMIGAERNRLYRQRKTAERLQKEQEQSEYGRCLLNLRRYLEELAEAMASLPRAIDSVARDCDLPPAAYKKLDNARYKVTMSGSAVLASAWSSREWDEGLVPDWHKRLRER